MKALNIAHTENKAEAAKKKTGSKDTSESYVPAATLASSVRSSFMRASAILDSGGNVGSGEDGQHELV